MKKYIRPIIELMIPITMFVFIIYCIIYDVNNFSIPFIVVFGCWIFFIVDGMERIIDKLN